ncbi:MAG: hypothetical protein ACLFUJ_04680 [Phycisphaerae bacterium]
MSSQKLQPDQLTAGDLLRLANQTSASLTWQAERLQDSIGRIRKSIGRGQSVPEAMLMGACEALGREVELWRSMARRIQELSRPLQKGHDPGSPDLRRASERLLAFCQSGREQILSQVQTALRLRDVFRQFRATDCLWESQPTHSLSYPDSLTHHHHL